MDIQQWNFWRRLTRRLRRGDNFPRVPRLRSTVYAKRNQWRSIYDIDAARTVVETTD